MVNYLLDEEKEKGDADKKMRAEVDQRWPLPFCLIQDEIGTTSQ